MASIDWAAVTIAQRKRIYLVMKAVQNGGGPSIREQVQLAHGAPLNRPDGFFDEMSKGEFARWLAREIHVWLAERHHETAYSVAPELFTAPADTTVDKWEAHLKAHATLGKLRIVSDFRQRAIGELRSKITPPDATLRLGEDFCFAFNSEAEATGLMIQIYQQRWHVMPVGRSDDDPTFPLAKGLQRFPRTSDGALDPIVERTHPGEHQFLLIVGGPGSLKALHERGLPSSVMSPKHNAGLHLVTAQIG